MMPSVRTQLPKTNKRYCVSSQPTFDNRRQVLITTLRENQAYLAGLSLATEFPGKDFVISTDARNPDIVLYLEYGYAGLTDLPLLIRQVRKYQAAFHFLYSESDWIFPVLPGAYPSLTKPVEWAESWCYLPRPSPAIQNGPFKRPHADLLFSFLGRVATDPLRKSVIQLDSTSTPCLDIKGAPQRFREYNYTNTYVELLTRSRFVLCPRGFGASSIRIFEAMSMGRVPVIISDLWRPPPGISWSDLSVIVPEKDVVNIPAILSRMDHMSGHMGEMAKQAYSENYAPEVFFDKLLSNLVQNYSWCKYSTLDTLVRAYHSVGWREIKTLGSKAKAQAVHAIHRLIPMAN